ncbi:LacI family transcriptional regulator [Diaminobutyricibacter tongyongensis]|uniref:LacI family transcriptional regulator n=1 Tax=Leifsonia tongyongensis TaxID=1268043 RepID=A0A6L9Y0K3_9MICO|nr:LacI family DNA-binding transcriptional regulator [Diaminobutyricibacter tongyongensis]NEN07173.1 LacI family transcriptional regulator [Diaminobutyricibacter tongyongensis]
MEPLAGAGSRRPATLADVAAASGVATSTVSRALSNPGRVNAMTRERIERAARELDYVPNSQARALTSGRTRAIAVLVSDVTNPFYFGIIRGTQQQLKAAGYTQLLIDTEESDEFEDGMLHKLRRSFDGAILAASRLTDRRLTTLATELPLVAINRQTRGVPSVFIDTPSGMEQALGHLVSLGHREIAYVSGPETSWPNEGRWRALQRAGGAYGVTVRRIGPFTPKKSAGAAAADALLNAGVTACIAFNDLLAIGMLMRLRERGVSVPDEISIVGCDDIFGADFCSPPLTTLTAPIEQAGRTAVSILLSRLESDSIVAARQSATLPTHLTIRASTGPAPHVKGRS